MLLILLPYIAVAATLILVLGLYIATNRNVSKMRGRLVQSEAKLEAEATQVRAAMGELKQKFTFTGTTEIAFVDGALAGGHSLNTTLRSKVLKMHQLGHPVERIADSLRVSKGEVDLLVKVHQIVMRPYEGAAAPANFPPAV